MESKINYTIVGAFVLILLSAIVITIVWLSIGFQTEEVTLYRVYMTEAVTGLTIDSSVKYNGVDVGKVKEIALDEINPQHVKILLEIKEHTPITVSTVATLNIQGLTGLAYIGLENKGTDTTPLRALEGEKYPVIKSAPSLFKRLDTAMSELTINLNQVSTGINKLLSDENQIAIKRTLNNLDLITTTLSNNDIELKTILQNTAKASDTLTQQTLPGTDQLIDNLTEVSNNLLDISREVKQNPSVLIRGRAAPPPGPGEK